jgi:hypothetical protein
MEIKHVFTPAIIIFFLSSCASLLSPAKYKVKINSVPREAIVTIYNRKGIEVFSDTTPCEVKLKSSAGFFRRGIYTLEFTREGYKRSTEVITAQVNEWYYGNILFGGWLGLLVVDPLTGAMYRLNVREITQVLTPKY